MKCSIMFLTWLLSVSLSLAGSALAQQYPAHDPAADPDHNEAPAAQMLSGTIVNWAYGEATIAVQPHLRRGGDAARERAAGGAADGRQYSPLATWPHREPHLQPDEAEEDAVAWGVVAEDGSFSIELPTRFEAGSVPHLAELLDDYCLLVRPDEARGFFVTELVVYRDDELLGFVQHQSPEFAYEPGDAYLTYAYAAEPVHVSGVCRAEVWTHAVDVVLEPGWSAIVARLERLTDGSLLFLERAGVAPEESEWLFAFGAEAYVGLGIVFEPRRHGMQITELIADGPAERAGLAVGDVIVMLDGADVRGMDIDTFTGLARGPRGSVALLNVLRGGENLRFEVERAPITAP